MFSQVWRLFSRGQRLQRRGRIVEASASFTQALALLEWDPRRPPNEGTARARLLAQALIARAVNLAYQGEFSSGMRMLDQAEPFAHPADRGLLFHQRAFIMWQNGRLSEALDWFAIAEPHLEAHGPDRIYAGMFLNRAGVWRDLGELNKGLESARRAVELYADIDSPVHQAKARHREALLWLDLGEITRALAVFDAVREQYRQHAPELEGMVLASYAHALLYVGMNRQAAEYWTQAIASLRSNGNVREAAYYEFWCAVATFEARDYTAGTEWARRSMDSLYRQGNEPMAMLAQLLILQGQFDAETEGPDFADRVQRLCHALEHRGWTLRLNQAKILFARSRIRDGKLDGVDELLRDTSRHAGYEALADNLARHLARAELATTMGTDPMSELRAGLELLDTYRVEFGSIEFQAGVSALGHELAALGVGRTGRADDPVAALEWVERCRAQALRVPPVKSSVEPAVQEVLGRLRQARQRLWDLEVEGQAAVEARRRVRDIEEEIRALDRATPGPRRQTDRIAPEAIHEVATEHETVVVNLFEVGGNLQTVLAGGERMRLVELMDLEQAAEIGRRLGADLDALGSQVKLPERLRTSVEASVRRHASALADGIWEPIAAYVGDRKVVIVPHSKLAWVPWPLLPPLRGRPVTVAPSAEAWFRAATRPRADGTALLAAGPALTTAGTEIDAIAGLYPGANRMTAEESDPELVLKALDGASVAHLAAHGHHEPDNVLFSRLDFGQGPLNAYELLGLDQPPGHVVLSACDLGRSTVAVGNETLGFTAALLHAGTSTVVSSLGRVPDDLAAEMMIDYHRRCAAGATPAEALAAAGEHRPWHPFVCFGA